MLRVLVSHHIFSSDHDDFLSGAIYLIFSLLNSSGLLPHIDDFDTDPIAEDHQHSHHNEL